MLFCIQLHFEIIKNSNNNNLRNIMSNTLLTVEQYFTKYKTTKESLDLPLKLNLYFTFLEASLSEKLFQKKIQLFNGFSPLFYPVFCHLSNLQKAQYLYANILFLKQQFNKIQSRCNVKQKAGYIGNSIKAQGKICESLMGLVYWRKVQVIFNFESRKVKMITKNRNVQIDLRLYLVRKSKKYQGTIVFQAISQIVGLDNRKISVYFNSTVFQHMYKEIFNCIILFRNQQLSKIAFQQLSNSTHMLEVSFIAHNSKSFNFLAPKNVNQFLNFKDATMKKILHANFHFQTVYSFHGRKIQVDRNSFNSKEGITYKLQAFYPCSVEQLKKSLLQKYSSQSYKYLIQSQQIQRVSNRYSAVYQKFLFQTSHQIFKTIQHVMIEQLNQKQIVYENQSLIFQKGLKSLKLDHLFEYLMIKVKRVNNQNKSKLIVVGCFNPQFKQFRNRQKNATLILDLPENHQIILMFLIQFSQMIFRKQYQVQNMRKIIEQLRGMDKIQQNQYITVEGNFTLQEKEEFVLDFDQKFGNEKSDPNFQVSLQPNDQKLQKVQSYVSQVDLNIHAEQQFQQFEIEEDNIKNFYILHEYQLKPHAQIVNQEKVQRKDHFLFHEWERKPKGGLLCKDDKMISQQKKVVNYLIKNLGKRIFQQKGLLNLSLPVTIFRPQSHLHSIARNLSFAPIFLEKAAKMAPQQRIKMVLLYSLSVTISSISISKPFNPILGQTLQVWIDGCPVYLQQISHHPPIVAYYMIGRGYKAYGSIGAKINFGFNYIIGYAQQPNFVQFEDGSVIQLNFGKMMIGGIIFGERIFNFIDKMYGIDQRNKIFYQLKFGDEKASFFSKSLLPDDFFKGKIFKTKDEFIKKFYSSSVVTYPTKQDLIKQLCSFEGIWNGKIYIDNKQFVDFASCNGCVVQEQKFPLHSDSSYRKDIQYLRQGSINSSQIQKQKLQNIQRRDRTLRQAHRIDD